MYERFKGIIQFIPDVTVAVKVEIQCGYFPMKRENTSNSTGFEDFAPPADDSPPHSADHPPDSDPEVSLSINFQGPEFNVTDDLDDNIGNYREFQSLDGIMTADMLHQKERRNGKKQAIMPENAQAGMVKKVEPLTGDVDKEIDSLPLTLVSRGRTLIIGNAEDHRRVLYCGELLMARGLSCTLCLITDEDDDVSPPRDKDPSFIEADSIVVRGSFCGFSASVGNKDVQMESLNLLVENNSSFDLVLDLQSVSSYAGTRLPIGYFAPGEDKPLLDEVLTELSGMKGRFTKPQFTVFQENRCLHGRSRSNNCERCLEICPVAAITKEHGRISINPHICQGCGSCALVCPADAIRMINPPQEELLARMRGLLSDHISDAEYPPVLIIHGEDVRSDALQGMIQNTTRRTILFEVEEIARIGLDFMLGALAFGAGIVIIVCSNETPADTIQALERQVRIGVAVLQGLNMQDDRIRFLVLSPEVEASERIPQQLSLNEGHFSDVLKPPALFSPECDKRTFIRLAVRHLHDVSDATASWISLPADAPFGTVALNINACTLCMTCVGICPTVALVAGDDTPQLSFRETECNQCGLCCEACPEEALQLLPRLHCTGDDHDSPAVLKEDEPFKCIECGTPFASPAMIESLQEKLAGHWMYRSDRQMNRLRMCRTCRTRDALMAKDFQA